MYHIKYNTIKLSISFLELENFGELSMNNTDIEIIEKNVEPPPFKRSLTS